MPRCPNCGAEITRLLHYSKKFEAYYYDGEGYERAEGRDIPGDYVDYTCPECGEVLFYSEDEAKEFLGVGEWSVRVWVCRRCGYFQHSSFKRCPICGSNEVSRPKRRAIPQTHPKEV